MRRRIIAGAAGLGMLMTAGMGAAHADHAGTNPTDPDAIGNHPALYGLCTAYFANGGNGNSHNAPPFAALAQAAEDNDQSVEEFCSGVRPGNGHGNGGGSNAPDPTEPRGNNR
jgi:hypothetical protein